ncbi:MAG: DUF2786 domain-containing protein [Rhodospirillaceae bacterium]
MNRPKDFSVKERARFRKLLEVANSTTYQGEKDAALAAATRLARSHGMSLHEAAGIKYEEGSLGQSGKERNDRPRRTPSTSSVSSFGETLRASKGAYHNQTEFQRAEKERYEQAMADAVRRGLDLNDAQIQGKRARHIRRRRKSSFRSRPDFIRVLLRETRMTAQEIASTVGVSVHDVFKEKLLMRSS